MGLSLFLLISNIMTFPFKKHRCGMASDKAVALGGKRFTFVGSSSSASVQLQGD